MTSSERSILIGFGTFIIGIPISIGIGMLIEYLFILDTEYCYEYRFPKLSWLLDFFYDGYHYDANLLNFLLTFTVGFYISNRLIKFKINNVIKSKSNKI